MNRLTLLMALWLTLAPLGAAFAQSTPAARVADPDVDSIRAGYEYGRYDEVIEKARARIDRGGLTRDQLVQLHKYAGLSAFNLGKQEDAARHFEALLRLDPDHALDPFAVSPPTVAFFEKMKKDLEPTLELIRQQLRLEAERQKREEEDRLRRKKEEEDRRRRLEELSRQITVRNVERRSFLVNFVPFGAGQFQQGRTAAGVMVASAEGAFALTSIIAYLALEGMIEDGKSQPVQGVDGIHYPSSHRGVPKERQREAQVWTAVKYGSAIGFYATYGYGVVDAIYHHEDQVVSTSTTTLPPEPERTLPRRTPAPDDPSAPLPAAPTPEPEPEVPVGPSVTGSASSAVFQPSHPRPFLYPTTGGLGAGVTLQF